MPWSHVPLNTGDDIQAWHWIRQFWRALQERGFCINQTVWFTRLACNWATGTITAATRTSLSDDGQHWAPDWWISNNGHDWVPDRYDVVIYDEDPRKIQRMAITGNDATTLHFGETDWYDPDIYVGKHYFIITGWGSDDSPWIMDRMPTGPNDHPLDYGKAVAGTASSLTDTRKQWLGSQWAGKHVVVEQGGRNRRGVISGNTATQLFFTGQGWVVNAEERYVIVDPDAVYEFGRVASPIYAWCGSMKSGWLTHDPQNDGIMTTFLPIAAMHMPDGQWVTVFDADVWTEVADENHTPDKCYTPAVFSTIRGLQIACESLCGCFVEPVDHTGRNALENFNLATWFECLGINTFSATITGVDTEQFKTNFSPSIAGMFLADSHEVFIACMDGYRVVWTQTATLTLADNTGRLDFLVNESDVGKRLIFAFGWNRRFPREFTCFYLQSVFLPDWDDEGPAIPPTPEYPGTWRHLPASSHYNFTTALGFVGESTDSHDVFVEGNLARYSGQNWNDPTLGPAGDGNENDPLVLLQNSYYVGKKSPDWQFGDGGIVSAGGTWWLRDDAKSWFARGTLVEHTGIATAGSATSLTDSTKAGDGFWTTADRGRFAEHILEITTGEHAGTRVPIDSQAGTTLSLRDLGFSVAGLGYRIREPAGELNRWQQRVLRITRADGTLLPPVVITHSDDNMLFFPPLAEPILPGWQYEIVEASTGTVWLRQGGHWVAPPPQTFGANPFAIPPTVARRYGRYLKGDYVTSDLFAEIQRAINIMRHIAIPLAWTAFREPWIDTPLTLGTVDVGGTGMLTDYKNIFAGDLIGKDVQIRRRLTGEMQRFEITGADGYRLSFDSQDFVTDWGDDYWVLDPDAPDVVLNDRIMMDSLGGGNQNDWTDVYRVIANDWDNPRYPGQRPRLADGKAPRCVTYGSDYQGYNDPGVFYYSATLVGTDAYGRANLPCRNWDGALFSAQSDFYAFTDYGQPRILPQHEAQFITDGEIGQCQKWVRFDTKASRTDGNPTISRMFGDVNIRPTAGQAPPPTPVPDGSTIYDTGNGYLVTDAKVVMRFETSGLLTFL